eukprot:TRINITY_DN74152_c0_g1_i1.p1 TRINITY_DN74152_c0_g1~~TRINITY_DN74152_c0_g1_i1.p1  ORF type:complete len:404 (-),score=59.61 TRINITY_DN74152_c0_g1_i1:222-1403(-)
MASCFGSVARLCAGLCNSADRIDVPKPCETNGIEDRALLTAFPSGAKVRISGLSGAAHLNGRRGTLTGTAKNGRVGVEIFGAGTKALRPENLRLLFDEGGVCGSRPLDVIRGNKDIGRMSCSSEFAKELFDFCASWSCSAEQQAPVVPQSLPDDLDNVLELGNGASSRRLLHFRLDAVDLGLVLEQEKGGWRVFQSFLKQSNNALTLDQHVQGYNALEWVSETAVGSSTSEPHRRLGAGKLLDAEDVRELLLRVQVLRKRCEDVVQAELLNQVPFEKPEGTLDNNTAPWLSYMDHVQRWASAQIKAAHGGFSCSQKKQEPMLVWMGTASDFSWENVMLRVSAERASGIIEIYTCIIGEAPMASMWLHLLAHAFPELRRTPETVSGWSYRVLAQ